MTMTKWGFAMAAAVALSGLDLGGASLCSSAMAAATAQPDVIMYATATCGFCKQARAYFEERHVSWREIDIDSSAQAQQDWQSKHGKGTPLIFIDGRRIDGFDRSKIDAALAAHATPAEKT